MTFSPSRPNHARHRLTALGFAVLLTVFLLGGVASAFAGGGRGGGGFGRGGSFGHPGGFMHGGGGFARHDGHGHFGREGRGFGHFHSHGFVDGIVVVPFGYAVYAPSPYDTYCNPASPDYDPRVCWDYYDD